MTDVEWIDSSGRSIELSQWITPSSFICETAAAAKLSPISPRRVCKGSDHRDEVVLYSDNAGMIQVLRGMQTRKHNVWRKTVGVGLWGMIKRG